MKRIYLVAGAMMLGLLVQAAEGKHIARAVLQSKTGATVASAQADPNGTVRFTNVPPGEYKIVLTSADGRSVTVADLDGDGHSDIIVANRESSAPSVSEIHTSVSPAGAASPIGSQSSGAGAGKVNVQDLSLTKNTHTGGGAGKASMSDLSVMKAPPAAAGSVTAPRDHASGLPTGKRMHKPYACLVDWDLATNKGGYASERAAQAEGEQLPDNTFGRCAIRVVVDEQPGTIEVLSWSWGASQAGKHNKTGHVTLMK